MRRTHKLMTKVLTLTAATLAAGLFTGVAHAHEGPGGPVGVGLGLGAPTGLTLEASVTRHSAIEAALGLNLLDEQRAYLHAVYKWSPADMVRSSTLIMPFYLGLGGFLADHDPEPSGAVDLGVRAPIGVELNFQRAPVQVFAEVALLATVIEIDHADHGVLGAGGYAGLRYWF